MTHKKITSSKFRLFSSFFLSFLAVIIVLFCVLFFLKQNFRTTSINNKKEIINICKNTLSLVLQNYEQELNSFYLKELFEKHSTPEIHQFLIENHYRLYSQADFVSFIDLNGKSYLSNGQINDVSNTKYYSQLFNTDYTYFINGDLDTPNTSNSEFLISKKVYDQTNNIKGALTIGVKSEQILNSITNIEKLPDMFVFDRDGLFLVNNRTNNNEFIFFEEGTNSTITAQTLITQGNGSLQIKTANGNNADLVFATEKQSGWIVASIFVRTNKFLSYFLDTKSIIIIVFIAIAIIMLCFVFFEVVFINFLYNKKIIQHDTDALTNLYSKEFFEQKAEKLLKTNDKYIIIDADIREFKFINSKYGSKEGNLLLQFFARELKKFIEPFHGFVGRGFGDHFYLISKITSVNYAMTIFKSQVSAFCKSAQNYKIPFFPKFGIVFYAEKNAASSEINIQKLISQATLAKNTIRNTLLVSYAIYDSKLVQKTHEQRYIENNFKNALENKEFFVVYQPKISLNTNKIVGAEALVRWNNKNKGIMQPTSFIPVLENNDFIKELDFYVYRQTFKFIRKLIDQKLPIVPISVNMSRNHNKPYKFVHDFKELINDYNIPLEYIQVELIERSYDNSNILTEITNELHKEGISVAMDDFGSGESSLNVLAKIPVDVIKFDREFLMSATNENGKLTEKSAKFIEILINLCKNLEKITVFEGAENKEQIDFLKSIKCDQVQGYFYSHPLEESDFIDFLKQNV